MYITNFLTRLLFPGSCPICGEVEPQRMLGNGTAHICPACEKKLLRVRQPVCLKCGKPLGEDRTRIEYCMDCKNKTHSFVQGRAVFVYQGAITLGMYRLKYSNRRDYAPIFAGEAYETQKDWLRRIQPEAIIPVPLHPTRRRSRGYNQAELIADALSKLSGIPLERRLVERRVNTLPQKELNVQKRKNNLKNAFQMSKNIVQLTKVLLVDDIYTTGSTVDAVAEVLMRAGIREVYVLCICIGGGE